MHSPRLGFGRVALFGIFFVVSVLLTVALTQSSPDNRLVGSWHLDKAEGIFLDETAGTRQNVGLLFSAATYPWGGPQQTYRYPVVVADSSGNEPGPAPQSLRALPSPDLTTFSQIHAVFLTADSAIIRWDTDAPSDSQIEYGTSASYGQTASLLESPVRSHALFLAHLTPNTIYHYRVISKDLAGTSSGIGQLSPHHSCRPPAHQRQNLRRQRGWQYRRHCRDPNRSQQPSQ